MSCCSLVTRDVSVTGEIPPVVIATPSRTRCDAVRSEGFSDREMHDPAPDDRPQALRRAGPGGEVGQARGARARVRAPRLDAVVGRLDHEVAGGPDGQRRGRPEGEDAVT